MALQCRRQNAVLMLHQAANSLFDALLEMNGFVLLLRECVEQTLAFRVGFKRVLMLGVEFQDLFFVRGKVRLDRFWIELPALFFQKRTDSTIDLSELRPEGCLCFFGLNHGSAELA